MAIAHDTAHRPTVATSAYTAYKRLPIKEQSLKKSSGALSLPAEQLVVMDSEGKAVIV